MKDLRSTQTADGPHYNRQPTMFKSDWSVKENN